MKLSPVVGSILTGLLGAMSCIFILSVSHALRASRRNLLLNPISIGLPLTSAVIASFILPIFVLQSIFREPSSNMHLTGHLFFSFIRSEHLSMLSAKSFVLMIASVSNSVGILAL